MFHASTFKVRTKRSGRNICNLEHIGIAKATARKKRALILISLLYLLRTIHWIAQTVEMWWRRRTRQGRRTRRNEPMEQQQERKTWNEEGHETTNGEERGNSKRNNVTTAKKILIIYPFAHAGGWSSEDGLTSFATRVPVQTAFWVKTLCKCTKSMTNPIWSFDSKNCDTRLIQGFWHGNPNWRVGRFSKENKVL